MFRGSGGTYTIGCGNIQCVFHFSQEVDQGGHPLALTLLIKTAEVLVGLAFAPRTLGHFISSKAGGIRRGIGKFRGPHEGFGRTTMILQPVPQQHPHLQMELVAIGIVSDPPLEKIPAQLLILTPGLDPEGLAGLLLVLHGSNRSIPRHMPRSHVPIHQRPGLQGGYRLENPRHTPPLGVLPGGVGLDPKNRSEWRAESAERGEESRLADALAQVSAAYKSVTKKVVRGRILKDGIRIDGRGG
jgi:hypothetical protein